MKTPKAMGRWSAIAVHHRYRSSLQIARLIWHTNSRFMACGSCLAGYKNRIGFCDRFVISGHNLVGDCQGDDMFEWGCQLLRCIWQRLAPLQRPARPATFNRCSRVPICLQAGYPCSSYVQLRTRQNMSSMAIMTDGKSAAQTPECKGLQEAGRRMPQGRQVHEDKAAAHHA